MKPPRAIAVLLRLLGLELAGALLAVVVAALLGRPLVEAVVACVPGSLWPALLGQLAFDLLLLACALGYAQLLRGRLMPRDWWRSFGGQLVTTLLVAHALGALVAGQWGLSPARWAGRLAALAIAAAASAWLTRGRGSAKRVERP